MTARSELPLKRLRKFASRGALGVGLAVSILSLACVGGCRHEPSQNGTAGSAGSAGSVGSAGSRRGKSKRKGSDARVGNGDPSGVDNQPDWDEMAAELRVRVGPRLPVPLPSDATLACTTMLDAARTFYTNTEASPGRRQSRLDELAATREDDMAQCVQQTSAAAATCVSVLLQDRDSEFPWLLDQCMRAYPRGA